VVRIKIKDLPRGVTVGREEMKKSLKPKPDTKGGVSERKGLA